MEQGFQYLHCFASLTCTPGSCLQIRNSFSPEDYRKYKSAREKSIKFLETYSQYVVDGKPLINHPTATLKVKNLSPF